MILSKPLRHIYMPGAAISGDPIWDCLLLPSPSAGDAGLILKMPQV